MRMYARPDRLAEGLPPGGIVLRRRRRRNNRPLVGREFPPVTIGLAGLCADRPQLRVEARPGRQATAPLAEKAMLLLERWGLRRPTP